MTETLTWSAVNFRYFLRITRACIRLLLIFSGHDLTTRYFKLRQSFYVLLTCRKTVGLWQLKNMFIISLASAVDGVRLICPQLALTKYVPFNVLTTVSI